MGGPFGRGSAAKRAMRTNVAVPRAAHYVKRPMAKPESRYVCQACGSVQSRWQGQCPDCAEWNTLVAEASNVTVFSAKHDLSTGGRAVELVGLDADIPLPERVPSGI